MVVNGKVELRKENGTLVRTIGNGDATNAYWSGNDIAIQTKEKLNSVKIMEL